MAEKANEYKIDWNRHGTDYSAYALYSRAPGWRGLWRGWQHVNSCKTKQEAMELHQKLIGLPIYLSDGEPDNSDGNYRPITRGDIPPSPPPTPVK